MHPSPRLGSPRFHPRSRMFCGGSGMQTLLLAGTGASQWGRCDSSRSWQQAKSQDACGCGGVRQARGQETGKSRQDHGEPLGAEVRHRQEQAQPPGWGGGGKGPASPRGAGSLEFGVQAGRYKKAPCPHSTCQNGCSQLSARPVWRVVGSDRRRGSPGATVQ